MIHNKSMNNKKPAMQKNRQGIAPKPAVETP